MVYKGVQYQDASRGSQLNSGFDFLYKGISAVSVSAANVDADHIKVSVKSAGLTHYYLARRGNADIYMATIFDVEPDTLNLARFIVRIPVAVLPNGNTAGDLRATVKTIESGDIFAQANGETRSKHYANMRLKDWRYFGATGTGVGMWMVRDNNEGNSGGPFYRSLLNQVTSTNQELTYIINYGEAQTEAYRTNILNAYTLVFNGGGAPAALDTSWFADMGLTGYTAPSARGRVTGSVASGRVSGVDYTIGFSNTTAQYWSTVRADGEFDSSGMLPGTYTAKLYKNELAVDTRSVVVTAGKTSAMAAIAVSGDPASTAPVWRIGAWDGSPAELLNGSKVTSMHPSDVRISAWTTAPFVIGTSSPATGFPAYQWKDVNGSLVVKFRLTQADIAPSTIRIGITTAFGGGRPKVQVNNWYAANQSASTQPTSRTLTVGTYRGNNTRYSFSVPASALVVGDNTLYLSVISGSGGTGYLSPGYAFDALDMVKNP